MESTHSQPGTAVFDLSGKTALITGGGTGLGLQFARTLGGAGARLLLAGRREAVLREACEGLSAGGIEAQPLPMNVADEASVRGAFKALRELTPEILVNNAGTAAHGRLEEIPVKVWDRVEGVNVRGAWLTGCAFVELHKATADTAVIVNVASVLGNSVQKGTGPYPTSKAALLQLTRHMAVEWARYGVRVNALLPGYYRTDMAAAYLDSDAGQALLQKIPQRRVGEPADLHGPILLLASEASRYMTGAAITVDGGLSIPLV